MNEWEAKYQALLLGIDNQEYIDNAEHLVKTAAKLAVSLPYPFDTVFWAMLHAIQSAQGIDTWTALSGL